MYGDYHDEEVPWPGPDEHVPSLHGALQAFQQISIHVSLKIAPAIAAFQDLTDRMIQQHGTYVIRHQGRSYHQVPRKTVVVGHDHATGDLVVMLEDGKIVRQSDLGPPAPEDTESGGAKKPRTLPTRRTNHGPRKINQYSRGGKQRW